MLQPVQLRAAGAPGCLLQGWADPRLPRFQGRDRYGAICHPQSGFSVSERTAYSSKIGNIRIRFHCPLEGKVKTATITRDCGEWYVSYVYEVEAQPIPATGSAVDVGTTWFRITSGRESTKNARPFQTAIQRVAQLHWKVSRRRLDFHHKTALKLVRENDLIAHEDLNVGGMG